MNDKDKCHLMIDLETLGTRSNAVILSIGVAQFDLKGNVEPIFHRGISIQSCLDAGLQVDGSTIEWWLSQKQESITNIAGMIKNKQYSLSLGTVLKELHTTVLTLAQGYIWSHGSNFDIVLLENAYKAVGGKAWWKYSNVRDTRTLFDIANYTYTAKGSHDALDDAMNQAKAVIECYGILKNGKDSKYNI